MSHLGQQDKFFLGATFATACVGAGLMVGGFIMRFGAGFGTFVTYAERDNDFLELERLDMIFGLFTAAAGILILSFFVALVATYKKIKFLLYSYCAMIALMIVVQLVTGLLAFQYADSIKQLASDDPLNESIGKAIANVSPNGTPGTDDDTIFWKHTQQIFSCCGVKNFEDWGTYSSNEPILVALNCFRNNRQTGCEKQIKNNIASDAQYLAVASMGVLLVEVIASFMAGYRAYNIRYDD